MGGNAVKLALPMKQDVLHLGCVSGIVPCVSPRLFLGGC